MTPISLLDTAKGRLTVWLDPLAAVLAFALCALLVTFPVSDYDTFWHLANGRAMFATGKIINSEIFSYTAQGNTFSNHQWLAQLLLYLAYQLAGSTGLIIFKIGITLLISAVSYRSARSLGISAIAASLLVLLAISAGLTRYGERPQLFSYLGLAVLAHTLYTYRHNSAGRPLALLPIIMVLWDFLHGAVFGVVLLGLFVVGESAKAFLQAKIWPDSRQDSSGLAWPQLKSLYVWAGITFLCMLINPYGLLTYDIFIDFVSGKNQMANTISEFQPTPLNESPLFWFALGLTTLSFAASWKKPDLTGLLIFVAFAFLGIRYQRCTAVFGIMAVPLIARNLSSLNWRTLLPGPASQAILRFAPPVILLLCCAFTWEYKFHRSRHDYSFGLGINTDILPTASMDFILDNNLQGNLFNTDRYGGVLAFFLGPQRRIFHYNHHKLFPFAEDYFHNPAGLIDTWGIQYALVGYMSEFDLFQKNGFVPVYWEPSAALLLKDTPENRPIIERFQIQQFRPLLTDQELRQRAQNHSRFPTLAQEISNHLRYRREERLASLLAELLASPATPLPIPARISLLVAAERRNATNAKLETTLGALYYQEKNLPEAKARLQQALSIAPDAPLALLTLAYLEYDLQNTPRAIHLFERLLKHDSSHADAIYGLSLSHFQAQHYPEAREGFLRYLQLVPNGQWADMARSFLTQIP